ncbi:MAG TPA: peptide ABC transporter substrate-binding protein [Candidatus Tumulicola sp.]|nr:peptide ABC transporter substrate-binding protein [Candidatus Tumulicola sp.]
MNARAGLYRLLTFAAAAAVLCACTKAGTAPSAHTDTLTIADGTGDIPTLNPHLFTETTLGYIAEMSQAYLVKYDSHNRPYPELVTEVPTLANGGISKDGDTITWHLRKGVRWSDGAPFNADDVVFSTKAVLNPNNNEVGRDGWNLITKIDEPDKYTVVYHLRRPYSPYLPTFFGSAGANPDVLPAHILAKYPNINQVPYNSKPVGIGPYRIVAWHRGDNIELEANPYYFRGEPKIKHIVYKLVPSVDTLATLMQTDEVQLWPVVPSSMLDRMIALTNLKTDIQTSPFYGHLDFNVTRPLVSDVRVREAIRYAINRPELIQKIAHGHAVAWESVLPSVVPVAPKDIPLVPYDPAKAKALLTQAGWVPGPDGIRVKNGKRLSLFFPYYTGSASADNTVEFIRQALHGVGIDIQTHKYAPAVFFAPYQQNGIIYGSKWDMTMFSWQALPSADISNNWECNQIPPNGQNVTHFCNKELDTLLEEVKGTYDEAKQRTLLERELKIIADNVPTIVLDVPQVGYTHSTNLTGFDPGAWTPFDNMLNVSI